jgi:hypothetical protein
MKIRLITAFMAVTALSAIALGSFADPAAARQSDWFVTASLAESVTNRAYKEITPSVPVSTRCIGAGGSLEPNNPGGPRFFQRFRCTVRVFLAGSTPTYKVTFRPRNKFWASLHQGWGLFGPELGRYRI